MTKPVIVNRATKGSPLTTAEHDQNFTNLQNATVGLRAGSAGTTVTADLNGVITLVAGSGVTFTGDNTAKTITVDASAANLTSNDLPLGVADNNTVVLRAPTGFSSKDLALQFDTVNVGPAAGGAIIKGTGNTLNIGVTDSANYILFDGGIDRISLITDQYDGDVEIGADQLLLRSEDNLGTTVECRLVLGNYTRTERNAVSSPLTGSLIHNETSKVLDFYNGTEWSEVGNRRSVRPIGENTNIVNGDIAAGWVSKDLFTYSISYTDYSATINGNIQLPNGTDQIGRLYTLHINKTTSAVVGFGVQGVFTSGQTIASGETGTYSYDIEFLGSSQWRLTRI
jgi:hypothetical protein